MVGPVVGGLDAAHVLLPDHLGSPVTPRSDSRIFEGS